AAISKRLPRTRVTIVPTTRPLSTSTTREVPVTLKVNPRFEKRRTKGAARKRPESFASCVRWRTSAGLAARQQRRRRRPTSDQQGAKGTGPTKRIATSREVASRQFHTTRTATALRVVGGK